jgi:heptosyltransferase-2
MSKAAARRGAGPPAGAALIGAHRILVVAPAWIGDMVIAHSLFRLLHRCVPGLRLDAVAPPATRPLLDFMPEIANSFELAVPHGRLGLSARRRLARQLATRSYDRAIILPRSFKAALLPFLAGIPERIGFRGEARFGLLTEARPDPDRRARPEQQRFAALALPHGAALPNDLPDPHLSVPDALVAATLADLRIARPAAPLLVLTPGAEYGSSKRWPPEHFAALARIEAARGRCVWLIGGPADQALGAAIADHAAGAARDLTGRTTLPQAVALLSLADAVVSNDSGMMHVAAALGRRQVALFGSSDSRRTPPLNPTARILTLGLSCSPCFKRDCPLGHHRCLRDLAPAVVAAALAA